LRSRGALPNQSGQSNTKTSKCTESPTPKVDQLAGNLKTHPKLVSFTRTGLCLSTLERSQVKSLALRISGAEVHQKIDFSVSHLPSGKNANIFGTRLDTAKWVFFWNPDILLINFKDFRIFLIY
jgi:hypothetical protein